MWMQIIYVMLEDIKPKKTQKGVNSFLPTSRHRKRTKLFSVTGDTNLKDKQTVMSVDQ